MMHILAALFVFMAHAYAEETPAFAPPAPKRAPQSMGETEPIYDNYSEAPQKAFRNKDGRDGARVQAYWDPMSSYSKFNTNGGAPSQFGYDSTAGAMFGFQAMWSVWAPSDWEFQTGIDWVIPLQIQGQQYNNFTPYIVNGQTLNLIGLKILQAGYHFNFGDFVFCPYGGFGIYYGKDSMTLTNNFSTQQTDLVNYTKLMVVYTAGARVDYNFNRQHSIAGGIGFEMFVPTKLSDQLSQSGSINSELPGQESYLQSNMDFLTGVGARIFVGLAGYF